MNYRRSSKDSDLSHEDTTFDSDSSRNSFQFIRSRRLYKSADNNTSCSGSYQSDSSFSDTKIMKTKQRNKKRSNKQLPPIGVFWDIENCHVPKNKSAASIVKRIREFFFNGYREAEFMIVCDVKKESAEIIQDLHDAQVNLIHVSSTSKNAADEKLRQSLRRFAEIFPPPSAVILISSDINFASDLSDLRYRKKLHVILIHKSNVADALMLCANETYHFSIFTDNLPYKKPKNPLNSPLELLISNLPLNVDKRRIMTRLKLLSNNCGGKVVTVDCNEGTATIRFTSEDFLVRAQKRLKGEDVYGCKINVNPTSIIKNAPCKSITGKKLKSTDFFQLPSTSSTTSNYPNVNDPEYYHVDCSSISDSILSANEEGNLLELNHGCTRAIKGAGNMLSRCDWRSSPQENYVNSIQKTESFSMSTDAEDSTTIYQDKINKSLTTTHTDVVELSIKNLDNSFHVTDIKRILYNAIKEHVMIVSFELRQTDGKICGSLKVRNQYDAQIVISQLHRMKLGNRRISVSCAQINSLSARQLEDMIISLLQESPGKQMPLFKLVELLQFQYHLNVSLSEVNKLKSVCKITEEATGRVISLVSDIRKSPNSAANIGEYLYCVLHYPQEFQNIDWNALEVVQLPYVMIPLKIFAEKLNNLLDSHMGTLPFLSLQHCYEYQFGTPLPVIADGVPLEHLVTCISNVELKYTGPNRNIKYIMRVNNADKQSDIDQELLLKGLPSTISSNIQLFCKEIVDLLKTTDRCQLLFAKFIPAYHHHFTRQCRVSDYGFTKLIDLLESPMLSNYVQVLGHGSRRIITLRHIIQMRRFMHDVRRVLKSQTANKITLREFPIHFEKIFSKSFNALDYGLCSLEDLLYELPETRFNIAWNIYPVIISITKKQHVGKEIMSCQRFAEQVVKLLCHLPYYSVLFDKFVPAYHHHFGYQCKISHYGFTKLIELFEAIPDTVKIDQTSEGERLIRLTQPRALEVLGNQLIELIKRHEFGMLPLDALHATYLREYGYILKPSTYEYESLDELLAQLKDYVKICESLAGSFLVLNAGGDAQSTSIIHIWSTLIEPPHQANIDTYCNKFRLNFKTNITLAKLKEFTNVVEVLHQNNDSIIKLTPLYVLAAELYKMLFISGGKIPLKIFEDKYKRTFMKNLNISEFGTNSLIELLHMMSFAVTINNSWNKLTVQINEHLSEFGIPLPLEKDVEENAEALWPPPPMHILPYNYSNLMPPKPDTPTNDTACGFTWNTPQREMSFQIDLPRFKTPNHIGDPYLLVSPTSVFARNMNCISEAPDPAKLPMPDKLLGKDVTNDDLHDSGLANNSNENDMYYTNDKSAAKLN